MNKLKYQTKNIISIAIITLGSIPIWFGAIAANTAMPDTTAAHLVFGGIVTVFTLALLYVVLRFFDKKPFNFIIGKNNFRAFLIGAGFFIVPAAIALAVSAILGFIEITPQASFLHITTHLILVAVLVFLSEALPEELIFRGYLFKKLSTFTKAWATIALQASLFLIFAFFIGAVSGLQDASFLLTFAITLGILRTATGSVWATIGFHLACMTFQQGFGSAWSLFAVSNPAALQTFIFAMIPFSIVIGVLASRVQWNKRVS